MANGAHPTSPPHIFHSLAIIHYEGSVLKMGMGAEKQISQVGGIRWWGRPAFKVAEFNSAKSSAVNLYDNITNCTNHKKGTF